MTADLVSWLHRQLQEDRGEAMASIEHPKWETIYLANVPKRVPVGVGWGERRWDAVEALRHAIDLHSATNDGDCRTCARWIWEWTDDACEVECRHAEPMPAPCPTLRGIGVQYAHRTGYRAEWAPAGI